MIDDSMIEEFKLEALEMISEAESALLSIENGSPFKENYNSVFRSIHSLKGGAGMFGMNELQQFVHQVETILSQRDSQEFFVPEFISFLLFSLDQTRNFFNEDEYNFTVPDELSKGDAKVLNFSQKVERPIQDEVKIEQDKVTAEKDGLIYIVDDEFDILDMIKFLIEDETNYEVVAFDNPEVALEAFKERNPDLVISDISMPQMSGLDLLEKLKLSNQLVPVIILSGFVTKESCLTALANGAAGIMEKPCNIGHLFSQIDTNIKRYQAFKLLNKSIDLLTYQFENFDKFLKAQDQKMCENFRSELKILLKQKQVIFKKAS